MAEEIVDRLKAEGQLIRNTGTNSIRAVRIQLDRFEEIFETISENISAQTQMMASMLDVSADQLKMSQETAEREEARRQREGLAADQTAAARPDITRDDLPNKKTRESRGLFDLLKGGTGFLNKLLMGALFAGGVYALGNVFKGFIDAKIGESEFTEALASVIDWAAIGIIFGRKFGLLFAAGDILSNVFDLPDVIKKITDAFNAEFTDNQAEGLGTALGIALTAAWLKGGLRFKIITGLIAATSLLGDSIKNWLINNADVDPDWANTTVDIASLGIAGALVGLGIAGMIGIGSIPAIIAGGIAGLAIGIAYHAYKWIKKQTKKARDRFTASVKDQSPQEIADAAAQAAAEGAGVLPPGAGAMRSGSEVAVAMGERIAELDTENILSRLEETPGSAIFKESVLQKIENLLDILEDESASEELKSEAIRQLIIMRERTQGLVESLRSTDNPAANIEALDIEGNIVSWLNEVAEEFSFRKGTQGFRDFGAGSFAILHGREAVVPEETPAGRFLNQFFTDNWLPKMAPSSDLADRVATAAGGTINMPVIVNNSPTVAPVVNNVQGGPNVTSTNVFGSGGSRSRTFGLSNAIN